MARKITQKAYAIRQKLTGLYWMFHLGSGDIIRWTPFLRRAVLFDTSEKAYQTIGEGKEVFEVVEVALTVEIKNDLSN